MSFAYLDPTEREAEIEAVEEEAVAVEAPRAVESYTSPEAQLLRVTLVQDQLIAAAQKVNHLHDMGLARTSGYAEALALYKAKLADFNQLKARYGL